VLVAGTRVPCHAGVVVRVPSSLREEAITVMPGRKSPVPNRYRKRFYCGLTRLGGPP
jgi:hypothetical protein